jgi:UDP-glucose 4-epimerase
VPETTSRTPDLVVGAGFIGTHLCETLVAAGRAPRLLTRSPLASEMAHRLAGTDVRIGDASIKPVVEAALEGVRHLFFCAGGLMPAESNLDPATDAALALPPLLNVLEALREHPDVGLTFLSSGGTVYGNPTRLPVDESHPTDPITSYGVMKLTSEKYALMYHRLYGVPVRVLRCSNVYGEGQSASRGQGLIAAVLHRALNGEPVTVFGDGLNERDFVHVSDLTRVMVELGDRDDGPLVLNVGSGRPTTLLDVIEAARRVTGLPIGVENRPDRGFDVRSIVLDIGALTALIDFEAMSLDDGLAATWGDLAEAART